MSLLKAISIHKSRSNQINSKSVALLLYMDQSIENGWAGISREPEAKNAILASIFKALSAPSLKLFN